MNLRSLLRKAFVIVIALILVLIIIMLTYGAVRALS